MDVRYFNSTPYPPHLTILFYSKGKGLRLSGSSNIIIQNIRISDLNPQYVWGGDAIGLEGATKIWVGLYYCCRELCADGYIWLDRSQLRKRKLGTIIFSLLRSNVDRFKALVASSSFL